jgi:hypothetical protein
MLKYLQENPTKRRLFKDTDIKQSIEDVMSMKWKIPQGGTKLEGVNLDPFDIDYLTNFDPAAFMDSIR